MRLLPLFVIAGLATAADDLAIARFDRYLVVTAPVTGDSDPTVDRLLGQRVTVHFQGATVDEVAEFIRRNTALNVVVAPTAGARPVTLQVRDMSLRFLLDWTCTVARIRHTWLDGAIYLTDQPVVANRSSTRLYDVSDLTMPLQDFPGPELGLGDGQGQGGARMLPAVAPARPRTTVDEVEALIRRVVTP